MTGMPSFQRRDPVGAAVVGVFSAMVAYFYYTGLYCSDDTRYLIGAIRIAIGEDISTVSLAERRMALLLPAAAMYALTQGIGPAIAIYAVFFVGLGLVAYALSRWFFGVLAATVVALLALAQPALFLFSGALAPDIAAAFFLALALYFLCRWTAVADADDRGGEGLVFAAAAGASIAVGFALKESSLVLVAIPALLVALGVARKRIAASFTAAMAMTAGFASVLLLEALLFRLTAGQWHSSVASLFAPHDFTGYADAQGRTLSARLWSLYYLLGFHTSLLFGLSAIASLQLLWECLRRRLSTRDAMAWLTVTGFWAWPTFYFTFGTASLSEYVLPVMQQRYYAPCVVPAALLAGRLLVSVAQAFRGSSFRLVLQALVCGALIVLLLPPYSARRERGLIYGAAAKEAFVLAMNDAVRRYPGVPIVDTDSGSTTDYNRCRLLLLSDSSEGRDRLLGIIHNRSDLKGRFDYADPDRLQPPFLAIGHGPFLSSSRPKRWVAKLERRINRQRLQVDNVGRYTSPDYRALRGLRWLPRERAVRTLAEAARAGGRSSVPENVAGDEGALQRSVEVYLVTGPDATMDAVAPPARSAPPEDGRR